MVLLKINVKGREMVKIRNVVTKMFIKPLTKSLSLLVKRVCAYQPKRSEYFFHGDVTKNT